MDFDELDAAVTEVARVLTSSGTLMTSLVHPLATSGTFHGDEDDAPFVIGSYFDRCHVERRVERGGLSLTLRSFHRTLSDYCDALRSSGLAVTGLVEPQPQELADRESRSLSESARRGYRIPMFLQLRTEKEPARRPGGLEALLAEWLDWFRAAMPAATPDSFLRKVREEAEEFLDDPSLEELSDLLVTLIGWLDLRGQNLQELLEASRSKLAKNQNRTWKLLPDGRYKHV